MKLPEDKHPQDTLCNVPALLSSLDLSPKNPLQCSQCKENFIDFNVYNAHNCLNLNGSRQEFSEAELDDVISNCLREIEAEHDEGQADHGNAGTIPSETNDDTITFGKTLESPGKTLDDVFLQRDTFTEQSFSPTDFTAGEDDLDISNLDTQLENFTENNITLPGKKKLPNCDDQERVSMLVKELLLTEQTFLSKRAAQISLSPMRDSPLPFWDLTDSVCETSDLTTLQNDIVLQPLSLISASPNPPQENIISAPLIDVSSTQFLNRIMIVLKPSDSSIVSQCKNNNPFLDYESAEIRNTIDYMLAEHDDYKPTCISCRKTFNTIYYIGQNIECHGKPVSKNVCRVCERQFVYRCTFDKHKTENALQPFGCSFCHKHFATKSEIREHIYSRHIFLQNELTKVSLDKAITDDVPPITEDGSTKQMEEPNQVSLCSQKNMPCKPIKNSINTTENILSPIERLRKFRFHQNSRMNLPPVPPKSNPLITPDQAKLSSSLQKGEDSTISEIEKKINDSKPAVKRRKSESSSNMKIVGNEFVKLKKSTILHQPKKRKKKLNVNCDSTIKGPENINQSIDSKTDGSSDEISIVYEQIPDIRNTKSKTSSGPVENIECAKILSNMKSITTTNSSDVSAPKESANYATNVDLLKLLASARVLSSGSKPCGTIPNNSKPFTIQPTCNLCLKQFISSHDLHQHINDIHVKNVVNSVTTEKNSSRYISNDFLTKSIVLPNGTIANVDNLVIMLDTETPSSHNTKNKIIEVVDLENTTNAPEMPNTFTVEGSLNDIIMNTIDSICNINADNNQENTVTDNLDELEKLLCSFQSLIGSNALEKENNDASCESLKVISQISAAPVSLKALTDISNRESSNKAQVSKINNKSSTVNLLNEPPPRGTSEKQDIELKNYCSKKIRRNKVVDGLSGESLPDEISDETNKNNNLKPASPASTKKSSHCQNTNPDSVESTNSDIGFEVSHEAANEAESTKDNDYNLLRSVNSSDSSELEPGLNLRDFVAAFKGNDDLSSESTTYGTREIDTNFKSIKPSSKPKKGTATNRKRKEIEVSGERSMIKIGNCYYEIPTRKPIQPGAPPETWDNVMGILYSAEVEAEEEVARKKRPRPIPFVSRPWSVGPRQVKWPDIVPDMDCHEMTDIYIELPNDGQEDEESEIYIPGIMTDSQIHVNSEIDNESSDYYPEDTRIGDRRSWYESVPISKEDKTMINIVLEHSYSMLIKFILEEYNIMPGTNSMIANEAPSSVVVEINSESTKPVDTRKTHLCTDCHGNKLNNQTLVDSKSFRCFKCKRNFATKDLWKKHKLFNSSKFFLSCPKRMSSISKYSHSLNPLPTAETQETLESSEKDVTLNLTCASLDDRNLQTSQNLNVLLENAVSSIVASCHGEFNPTDTHHENLFSEHTGYKNNGNIEHRSAKPGNRGIRYESVGKACLDTSQQSISDIKNMKKYDNRVNSANNLSVWRTSKVRFKKKMRLYKCARCGRSCNNQRCRYVIKS